MKEPPLIPILIATVWFTGCAAYFMKDNITNVYQGLKYERMLKTHAAEKGLNPNNMSAANLKTATIDH